VSGGSCESLRSGLKVALYLICPRRQTRELRSREDLAIQVHPDDPAGVTKLLLQMRHGQLAPSLHGESLNPLIPWAAAPFRLQTWLEPWPQSGRPWLAGVSSFGAGGANAHLVLEAWPRPAASAPAAGDVPLLLPLSARSSAQLAALAGQLARHLRAHPELNLADCCWTLQQGRQAFECRAAWVVSSREAMLECLDALAAGRADARILSNAGPRAPGLFDPEEGTPGNCWKNGWPARTHGPTLQKLDSLTLGKPC